jgi:hypothetical protein
LLPVLEEFLKFRSGLSRELVWVVLPIGGRSVSRGVRVVEGFPAAGAAVGGGGDGGGGGFGAVGGGGWAEFGGVGVVEGFPAAGAAIGGGGRLVGWVGVAVRAEIEGVPVRHR